MDEQKNFLRNESLFKKMDKTIREEKLFMDKNLCREQLCQLLCIDRNRFAQMIKQHSGATNLNDYINKVRLEHAVKVMRDKPRWTQVAIAEACGMSLTTFKRCFAARYHTSPSHFRKQLLQA
ncbi:MAG: AraC family transcriptional regulator [Prevotella sp.]|nr:AraC family transcriptional regulator [Prevotella sp.]MBR3513699.1 AraC family transcriptional regulator [Bacteroidaceae bacterium]